MRFMIFSTIMINAAKKQRVLPRDVCMGGAAGSAVSLAVNYLYGKGSWSMCFNSSMVHWGDTGGSRIENRNKGKPMSSKYISSGHYPMSLTTPGLK